MQIRDRVFNTVIKSSTQPTLPCSRISTFCMITLCLLLNQATLSAAIESATGNINFDNNSDGNFEMTLNSNGLGIGTTDPSSNLHVLGNAIISTELIVGGTINTSSSTLHISGTIAYSPITYTSGTNIIGNTSLVLADTSSGNVVLELPDANVSQMITIKRISTNNTLFIVGGGNSIDGDTSMIFESGNLTSINLVSSGGSWYILSEGASNDNVGLSSDNLFLLWSLNETSGNTAADTGPSTTRSGNLSNNHQFSGNTTTGILDTALKLGHCDTVEYSAGGLPSSGYSYSIWVNYSGASNASIDYEPNIVGKAGFVWASGNSRYHMSAFHQLDASGNYASTAISSTASLSADTWYHIATTWDGSNLNLYLNGQYESGNTAATWVAGDNILVTNPGTFKDSTIKIDDVRFFSKALSSDQVQSLYYLGSQ